METQTELKAEVLPASKSSLALADVSTAIAEFNKVAAGIGELKSKYAGVVFDVKTTKGMVEARAARIAIRQPRYEVERIRKEAKAPIIKLGKDLEAEAARITAEILAIENPIDEQIKNEETRVENERRAKIEAEQKRVADIHARIAGIRGIADGASLKTSAEVKTLIDRLQAVVVDESFAEFRADAQKAYDIALESLTAIHASRVAFEAEQERIRIERIELDRQKAEQEERDRRERERIAEEERVAKAARDAEVARQTEELRKQREAQAKLDEEARSRREAEERAHQEKLKAAADVAELNEMRMQEIMAMGHQVMIATGGRAGVRVGGTRECIVETLEETQTWEVTDAKFGPLTSAAMNARTNACEQITALLLAFDQRVENERIAAEQQRQREAIAAEEARLAAERERIEQIENKTIDVVQPITIDHGQVITALDLVKKPSSRPSDQEIIGVLALHYRVHESKIVEWLLLVDLSNPELCAA